MFIGGGRNWKEDLTMGLLTAKVVSMCLLGAVSMAVGLLPLVFKRFAHQSSFDVSSDFGLG